MSTPLIADPSVLLVDTGVLVAAADVSDRDHRRCAALLENHPGPLITTSPVVTESGWLIRRQLGVPAEIELYESLARGEIEVVELTGADWSRVGGLLGLYRNIGLDAADASLVAVAERLGQSTVATLDERDFRIIRPSHVEAFELLPGPS